MSDEAETPPSAPAPEGVPIPVEWGAPCTPDLAPAEPRPASDEIIDRWVAEIVRGSPIARHADSWNFFTRVALAELRRRLTS